MLIIVLPPPFSCFLSSTVIQGLLCLDPRKPSRPPKGEILGKYLWRLGMSPRASRGNKMLYNFAVEHKKSALLRLAKYRISFCSQSEIICTQRWEYPAPGWVVYPSFHHPLWSPKEEKVPGAGTHLYPAAQKYHHHHQTRIPSTS